MRLATEPDSLASMSTTQQIARLKITLDHVRPTVMRRIEVPLRLRLDRLHVVIQFAMGWAGTHLYEFRPRVRDIGWGVPVEDDGSGWFDDGPRDASKTTLGQMLAETGLQSFKYIYDFGDDWSHTVKVERIVGAELWLTYPRMVDAKGRCPPEDIGGPWGYAEYVEAMADPHHPRYAEMSECPGPGYVPGDIDAAAIAKHVDELAAGWAKRQQKGGSKRKAAA